MRRMLEAMRQKQNTPTMIFCDNKSHIDIWFHKIQEWVIEKEVVIEYYPTKEQVADIFTKPLKVELFYKLKKMLGIISIANFKKILDDLENLEVKLEDEDKTPILLSALPSSYEHFKDAILFGRDQTIMLDEDCSERRNKDSNKLQELGDVAIATIGYETANVLVVSNSEIEED
ncbi:Copia protein, partial [Mucuna pruriens]